MSASPEIPGNPADPHPYAITTVERMYRTYVTEDLDCHQDPEARYLENPIFTTSLMLAQAMKIHRTKAAAELAATPEMEIARHTIQNLPQKDTYQSKYYRSMLVRAYSLAVGGYETSPLDLQQNARQGAIDRALATRDMLMRVPDEKASHLKNYLGSACVQALLNRDGLALSAMPHQLIDMRHNPHAGILAHSDYHKFSGYQRFAVNTKCGGFAEGHKAVDEIKFKRSHLKRVRLLSACCDLRLTKEDGRQEMYELVDLLADDVKGNSSPAEQTLLHHTSDRLVQALISDPNRKGSKLTPRQYRQKRRLKAV